LLPEIHCSNLRICSKTTTTIRLLKTIIASARLSHPFKRNHWFLILTKADRRPDAIPTSDDGHLNASLGLTFINGICTSSAGTCDFAEMGKPFDSGSKDGMAGITELEYSAPRWFNVCDRRRAVARLSSMFSVGSFQCEISELSTDTVDPCKQLCQSIELKAIIKKKKEKRSSSSLKPGRGRWVTIQRTPIRHCGCSEQQHTQSTFQLKEKSKMFAMIYQRPYPSHQAHTPFVPDNQGDKKKYVYKSGFKKK
jgi:hypothetical protein